MTLDDYRWWASTPLDDDLELTVVVPAYNESERILPTVGALASHLSTGKRKWELIVSDDGSSDDTVQIVSDLGLANLRVLVADENGGKGRAVRNAVMAARGRWILFVDADQSTPIEQFELLQEAMVEAGAGVAVGSRADLDADSQQRPPFRRLLSWGLRTVVGRTIDTEVRDTQCGFKLFTREAGRTIFWFQRLDGFSFDLEVLHLATRYGFGVIEVPIRWIDAPGSTVRAAKVSLEVARDLVLIRVNQLARRYGAQRPDVPVAVPNDLSWMAERTNTVTEIPNTFDAEQVA